nr:uncharacterized protein LOC128688841 [Cherax quadricarinatus]
MVPLATSNHKKVPVAATEHAEVPSTSESTKETSFDSSENNTNNIINKSKRAHKTCLDTSKNASRACRATSKTTYKSNLASLMNERMIPLSELKKAMKGYHVKLNNDRAYFAALKIANMIQLTHLKSITEPCPARLKRKRKVKKIKVRNVNKAHLGTKRIGRHHYDMLKEGNKTLSRDHLAIQERFMKTVNDTQRCELGSFHSQEHLNPNDPSEPTTRQNALFDLFYPKSPKTLNSPRFPDPGRPDREACCAQLREGLSHIEQQQESLANFYKNKSECFVKEEVNLPEPFNMDLYLRIFQEPGYNSIQQKQAISDAKVALIVYFNAHLHAAKQKFEDIIHFLREVSFKSEWERMEVKVLLNLHAALMSFFKFVQTGHTLKLNERYLYIKTLACKITKYQNLLESCINKRIHGSSKSTWEEIMKLADVLHTIGGEDAFRKIIDLVNIKKKMFAFTYVLEKTVEAIESAEPLTDILSRSDSFWKVSKTLPALLTYLIIEAYCPYKISLSNLLQQINSPDSCLQTQSSSLDLTE